MTDLKDYQNEKVFIYTLGDETGVRYVGQTNNPKIRLTHHKREALTGRDKTRKGVWLKALLESGQKPVMSIIDECTEIDSCEKESYWIGQYCDKCNLLNHKITRPRIKSRRTLEREAKLQLSSPQK